MPITQEFLILDHDGILGVYAPSQFPLGTPIGPDARRLRVVGEVFVRPPSVRLSPEELDRWRRQVEQIGSSVTLGPYRSDPEILTKTAADFRPEEFVPLREAFDDLLREAERRRSGEDPSMGAVESRHP